MEILRARASSSTETTVSMRGNGRKEMLMDMAFSPLAIFPDMRATGMKANITDRACLLHLATPNTPEPGPLESTMELELLNGQMALSTKESSKTAERKAMESLLVSTEQSMKEAGRKESTMAKDASLLQLGRSSPATSRRESIWVDL
jgi:hypothetical protein